MGFALLWPTETMYRRRERERMAEEQLERIEKTLTSHGEHLARHDARFDVVDARFDAVDARFNAVDRRFDALDQRIGVMHEDLIRRIAGASERNAVSRQELKDAVAALTEQFGRRLDPLEAAVREHSRDIAELKRTRQ
jgi:hypothetical protein